MNENDVSYLDEIIDQLTTFCDCVPQEAFEEDNRDKLLRNVEELIFLVSILTCWTNEPCETFLNSERQEVIDIPDFDPCSCECDVGVTAFKPYYYKSIDVNSFEVFVVNTSGLQEEIERVDAGYYAYSELSKALKVDVRPYVEKSRCNPCDDDYKLLIKYNAGYDLIPDCLLQLFCDLLHVIYNKNNCDCSTCQACKDGDDNEPNIVFDDETSETLDDYLHKLVESAYKKQIGLISLCQKCCGIWGVVI